MKTQTETNWLTHKTSFIIEDVEYDIEAVVFTESNWRGTVATCEGWTALPECLPPHLHYGKLETLLLNEIEERYSE